MSNITHLKKFIHSKRNGDFSEASKDLISKVCNEPHTPLIFRAGDKVSYTNGIGVTTYGLTVIGFAPKPHPHGGGYIYLDKDTFWHPVHPENLAFEQADDEMMEAVIAYCNAMSYHQPDTHYVYVGKIGNKSEQAILQTAARQINFDGSLKPEQMGSLNIIGYRPCTV